MSHLPANRVGLGCPLPTGSFLDPRFLCVITGTNTKRLLCRIAIFGTQHPARRPRVFGGFSHAIQSSLSRSAQCHKRAQQMTGVASYFSQKHPRPTEKYSFTTLVS